MKLYEFFNVPVDQTGKEFKTFKKQSQEEKQKTADEVFWYILDHDKLHKDYFFPIANKLKKLKECGDSTIFELFMPMVVKGCREYYAGNKMEGKLGKEFPMEMREELCKRLYDHFREDLKQDKYQLGK